MPKRMLKDWTASENVDKLTPQAEVFFTRLIMKADDFGVFPNNDRLLKSTLYPLKDYGIIEVGAWKKECIALQLIIKFTADGKEYLAIKNFDQKLRRMKHTYPAPPMSAGCRTSVGQVSDDCPPEEKGSRREGEENRIVTIGDPQKSFVVVEGKYAEDKIYKIHGPEGLNEYFEMRVSKLTHPNLAPKFLLTNDGQHYSDLNHLKNAYKLFVEKEFK